MRNTMHCLAMCPYVRIASHLLHLQAAAAVLQAYPPRGSLNLNLSVDKQPVASLISGIDRTVIQDYVIDTVHYFDGDNNELARRLGIGMVLCTRVGSCSRQSCCSLRRCMPDSLVCGVAVHHLCARLIWVLCVCVCICVRQPSCISALACAAMLADLSAPQVCNSDKPRHGLPIHDS